MLVGNIPFLLASSIVAGNHATNTALDVRQHRDDRRIFVVVAPADVCLNVGDRRAVEFAADVKIRHGITARGSK